MGLVLRVVSDLFRHRLVFALGPQLLPPIVRHIQLVQATPRAITWRVAGSDSCKQFRADIDGLRVVGAVEVSAQAQPLDLEQGDLCVGQVIGLFYQLVRSIQCSQQAIFLIGAQRICIGQYQRSTFNNGALDGEVENFLLLGLNFEYRFNPNWATELGYNFDRLDSDVTFRTFTRNRVYVGVRATY